MIHRPSQARLIPQNLPHPLGVHVEGPLDTLLLMLQKRALELGGLHHGLNGLHHMIGMSNLTT